MLTYIAVQQKTLESIPTPASQEIVVEESSPIEVLPERGEPTPRAPEPLPPGTTQSLFPQEVHFWVNDVRVPAHQSESSYIPIKQSSLKTFAGSFGPYEQQPQDLRVVLCAELTRTPAAPACEVVPTIYRERYLSFARGYQYDEYIGGFAAKDYTAYYTVYSGETPVGHSNRAIIRTVHG